VKKSSPRKTTARSATSKSTPARKPATTARSKRSPTSGAAKRKRTATVTLPFVTAEFRVPEVHLPRPNVPHLPRPDLTDAAKVVGSHLPPRQQVAHDARLGAGAVVGLIGWPAAASLAAIRKYTAKRADSGAASRRRPVRKST